MMTGTAAEWEQYTFSQQLEKEFGVNDANMRTVEFPSYAPIATQDIKEAFAKDRRVPRFDDVQKPRHYGLGKVEAIEAIEASMSPEEYKGYLKGNTLKYLWRYQYKQKPLQDLQKADWYLRKLIKANGG